MPAMSIITVHPDFRYKRGQSIRVGERTGLVLFAIRRKTLVRWDEIPTCEDCGHPVPKPHSWCPCDGPRRDDHASEPPREEERCDCGNVMTHHGLRLCDRCAEQAWQNDCANDCNDPDATAPAVVWVERDPRNR